MALASYPAVRRLSGSGFVASLRVLCQHLRWRSSLGTSRCGPSTSKRTPPHGVGRPGRRALGACPGVDSEPREGARQGRKATTGERDGRKEGTGSQRLRGGGERRNGSGIRDCVPTIGSQKIERWRRLIHVPVGSANQNARFASRRIAPLGWPPYGLLLIPAPPEWARPDLKLFLFFK